MQSTGAPPWRNGPVKRSHGPPSSSIPRKRPAEDRQEAEWVAGEDRFVLGQAKKKATIRVKEGRARPIDWLAVTLRFIDNSRNPFDDEIADSELDVVDPEGVFEGLDDTELAELEKEISHYHTLETDRTNRDFWETMSIICKDRRERSQGTDHTGRVSSSVNAEVDRMFSSKSLQDLETLEKQIKTKLRSNEPMDVDYWEQLLRNLGSWKARAKLKKVSRSIVDSQLDGLKKQQQEEAVAIQTKLAKGLGLKPQPITSKPTQSKQQFDASVIKSLDPEALLKVRAEDKSLETQEERQFLDQISSARQKILKLGFVPKKIGHGHGQSQIIGGIGIKKPLAQNPTVSRSTTNRGDEFSQVNTALYEREVARGVNENEEIFAGEEEVTTSDKWQWADKYRPRKPRYFNRVQMGYEWNKYNQTHYDHDSPPPKVVQGYKFNIFYPDLIDRQKAPTYKIERENGRKRGESFAPAGEEDTCLIRFVAGPPYEDVAFRIVDKEWDYSAKRERGFKSSFDKGILQLHFQFKRVYYRK